jgi:hypothetical protein
VRCLLRLRSGLVGRIIIYVDREDPLAPGQAERLLAMTPDLTLREGDKVTGWGEQTVAREIQVFHDVAGEVDPQSYIAKVDSDIYFLSDRVFKNVLASGSDLYGHPEDYWQPFIYSQGGCYFLKASLARAMTGFDPGVFSAARDLMNDTPRARRGELCGTLPEDAVVYLVARGNTSAISLRPFYEDQGSLAFGSLIHFQGTRDIMLQFAQRYSPAVYPLKKLKAVLKRSWRDLTTAGRVRE